MATRYPILWLTVRQFRAGKTIRVAAFFAAISVILGAIYQLGPQEEGGQAFLAGVYLNLLAPTVVPLATLILATSAFGSEIGDYTLPYLVLKPISRARIVLEKYVAVVAVVGLFFLIGLALTWGTVVAGDGEGDWSLLAALVGAALGGVFAYGALFLLVSLLTQRALVLGIIYVLLWESLLARFIPGIQVLSVRHFTDSIFAEATDQVALLPASATHLDTSALVLAGLVVVALALATLRLRTMNVD